LVSPQNILGSISILSGWIRYQDTTQALHSGFPRSVEKVLNCEIGFEDLVEVWNLAKLHIKHLKSMEIPNRKETMKFLN